MQQALFIVLAVTIGALAMPAKAYHNSTACERSADKMFRSCRFEINEEYYATTAMCINQTGPDDPSKPACFDTWNPTTCGSSVHNDFVDCNLPYPGS